MKNQNCKSFCPDLANGTRARRTHPLGDKAAFARGGVRTSHRHDLAISGLQRRETRGPGLERQAGAVGWLAELRSAGLIANADAGYALTSLGQQLYAALSPLRSWAERWKQTAAASKHRA
jgi:hypothetical protein